MTAAPGGGEPPLFMPLSSGGPMTAYLFPFAGGSASAFRPWARLFGQPFSVLAAQLPGRQDRSAQPPFRRMADLAAALAGEIAAHAPAGPFLFFGHSMGGLAAYEVARELRRCHARPPALLGISGTRPPGLAQDARPAASLTDQELAAASIASGGMPPEAMQHAELLELVVRPLRADLDLVDAYQYHPEPPLPIPMSVFGGSDDDAVTPEDLEGWRAQGSSGTTVRTFTGGHFYIWEHGQQVVAALLDDLERTLNPGPVPVSRDEAARGAC